MMCILVEVLLRANAKRGICFNDFKFGTSIGRHFSSDGAASMAVKGFMMDHRSFLLRVHV